MNRYSDYAYKDYNGEGAPDKINQNLIKARIALCETLEKLYDSADSGDIETYKYICETYKLMLRGRI